MFTLLRWILGPTLTLFLIGYLLYQNTYNTPEARLQRNMTHAIDSMQQSVSQYTGIPIPKEQTPIDKIIETIKTSFKNMTHAPITQQTKKVAEIVTKAGQEKAAEAYSQAEEYYKQINKNSAATHVHHYNQRTSNNQNNP